ncbi:SAVED domain-containing protein, partial [Klebsiella variicola]|uniref:SAVED domain-containing protein n=1 Tax=Klebsiella variicola TaxID=244366 RepID=UPI0039C02288
PIHVFAAIPAALAIEFGALLTTQHQHTYLIFDRDKENQDRFTQTLQLGSVGSGGQSGAESRLSTTTIKCGSWLACDADTSVD